MNPRKTAVIPLLVAAILLSACSEREPAGAVEDIVFAAPDAEANQRNNRAVGLMGQFDYAGAQAAFQQLAEQWPQWQDVRLNLAIATLNRQQQGDENVALALAQEVLRTDDSNLRAHYIAGLMMLYLGDPAAALVHFDYVADNDPGDAYATYYRAQCLAQQGDNEAALHAYRRAIATDPYLRSAYYGAFQSLQRIGRAEEARALAADYQRLEHNPRSRLAEFKYTRMGPKAEVLAVGGSDIEARELPSGELFIGPEPLPIEAGIGPLRHWDDAGRGPSFTTVDLQGDGLPDLFLAGVLQIEAAGGGSSGGNLVLQGQVGGGYLALTDHPLAAVAAVNAALWGDFDNDGLVDVYLCRRGENQLWQQTAPGSWENITAAAGAAGGDLDTVDGAFFDADHDGDLDLFLVNSNGPNELLNNNLDGTFRPLAVDYGLAGTATASTMVLPVDLDNDRDADLIVLNEDAPHEVYINDRLWSYRPGGKEYEQFVQHPALTAIAADIDADGLIELFTVDPDGSLLRWRLGADKQLQPETLATPVLLDAVPRASLASHDVNGDGTPDLLVSSPRGWTAFSITTESVETLYEAPVAAEKEDLASLPFIGGSLSGPGMLVLREGGTGITAWQPGPGRFPFLTLRLSGRQDSAQSMRSNASGVGSQLTVRSGMRWSRLHNYRTSSSPGQSLQPLAVGLAGASSVDFVSVDWSDGVFQSELDLATGRLHLITETQRQLSSCPVLFAWDGEEYRFVSDVLGVGGVGYATGPGQYSTPRPWENFLLPAGLLRPKNGHLELKIAEPMEENAYLDAARLAIYDLPPGWQMVMDERMGISDPLPTGAARFYQREQLPTRAVNGRGEEVLGTVLTVDGVAAPVGELDSRFVGRLRGEHILELEFPRPLEHADAQAILVIDGWVEYPYSQTNFAAWQAGATFRAPSLDAATADGEWRSVVEEFGYPAGMPRRMSLPLSNLPAATRKLRLRTNLQVYWDRIAVVYAESLPEHRKQLMLVASATLRKAGFARRSNLDQFRPHYDYAKLSPFWDTRYMAGYYTRLGPVDELVSGVDDAVAIIGPGEEVHLQFDMGKPAPAGWSRHYVLESHGWAKDMDLFTRDGETVGPLPTTGPSTPLRDTLHARYNDRYQAGH